MSISHCVLSHTLTSRAVGLALVATSVLVGCAGDDEQRDDLSTFDAASQGELSATDAAALAPEAAAPGSVRADAALPAGPDAASGPAARDAGATSPGQPLDAASPARDGGASAPDAAGGAMGTEAGTAAPDAGGAASAGCRPKFSSGLNVAWFNFAGDVPRPDMTRFSKLFADTHAAGGRVVRWWFHTNGTVTPGYDSAGLAKPIAREHIDDVRKILDAATAAGVSVVLSLWSFDMLQGNQNAPLNENLALLTQDRNRQAYIDNVLIPLVRALSDHAGLHSWEIFNEPEGMTTQHGWTTQSGGRAVDRSVVQKCVNWFADAIHNEKPAALVTNGAWQFAVVATVDGHTNLYSDAALRQVGGRTKGTLDYYQVHYYDNWGGSQVVSPFTHASSYWKVDKPIAIGEFWAKDTNGIAAGQLFTKLFDQGYSGAWAWQYANNDGSGETKWPAMQVPMQNLYKAHPADLECGRSP